MLSTLIISSLGVEYTFVDYYVAIFVAHRRSVFASGILISEMVNINKKNQQSVGGIS